MKLWFYINGINSERIDLTYRSIAGHLCMHNGLSLAKIMCTYLIILSHFSYSCMPYLHKRSSVLSRTIKKRIKMLYLTFFNVRHLTSGNLRRFWECFSASVSVVLTDRFMCK